MVQPVCTLALPPLKPAVSVNFIPCPDTMKENVENRLPRVRCGGGWIFRRNSHQQVRGISTASYRTRQGLTEANDNSLSCFGRIVLVFLLSSPTRTHQNFARFPSFGGRGN